MNSPEPTILDAIIYALVSLVLLVVIVIAVSPFWDWLSVYIMTIDSPLVSVVMPLFKWFWLIIALSVISVFAYVWLVVIRKIRYNRMMEDMYR
ncbi:MAG: hypothetical protein M0R03_14850 [Novosphingobium sp.]|nr:hypothetical protein [Novosphingobium sp.]